MAGDWIKFEIVTPDKPEVWEIADKLNLDPDAVVGKLIRMWIWFNTQTENGHASIVTKKIIDRDVGVNGFCDEVINVNWLHQNSTQISIESFDRHNGNSAKTRALGQKRKAKQRHAEIVTEKGLEKRREDITTQEKIVHKNNKFEEFWKIYPALRKGSKSHAKTSFNRKIRTKENIEKILSNVEKRNSLSLQDGWGTSSEEYIPHAATFINRGQWEDEIEVTNNNFEYGL
jgi:hypothetical protein